MRRQHISGITPSQLLGEKVHIVYCNREGKGTPSPGSIKSADIILQGLAVAGESRAIEVHNFRRDEMDSLLKYFTENSWFQRGNVALCYAHP